MQLFSTPARELGLFLMAGERKIQALSDRKAPVDRKGCKFAKSHSLSVRLLRAEQNVLWLLWVRMLEQLTLPCAGWK